MSLDVTIVFKNPKTRTVKAGYDGAACGSNVAYYDTPGVIEETEWWSNITHNMGKMAKHIPVHYTIDEETYTETLYMLVWRPDEVGIDNICCNTNVIAQALQSGISYMVAHREELLKYNPENGWGNYDSFLNWLIEYWKACLKNPDCKISVDR